MKLERALENWLIAERSLYEPGPLSHKPTYESAGCLMMEFAGTRLVREEKGLAMVLALMLITLLACFGMWLLLETRSGFRVTSSFERIEENSRLAEAACWLSVRALDSLAINLPPETTLKEVTPTSESYLAPDQPLGKGQLTPGIRSARNFYNSIPPAGWMLNWQGGSAYHRCYYLDRGEGVTRMPQSKGDSKSVLFNFAEKVKR